MKFNAKLCPHGILGISKCVECVRAARRRWLVKHHDDPAYRQRRREHMRRYRESEHGRAHLKERSRAQTSAAYLSGKRGEQILQDAERYGEEGGISGPNSMPTVEEIAWFANLEGDCIFQDWPRFEATICRGRLTGPPLYRRLGSEVLLWKNGLPWRRFL